MAVSNGASSQSKSTAHIIVIRLSAMGDVAMTVPVLATLIKQYPDVRLTVLTRRLFAPMFAHLENVFVFEADLNGRHTGVLGLWRLFRELKKRKPDAVADLHNVLRSNLLKLFFAFTAIRFVQIDKGRAEKRALTAAKNKVFKPLMTTHERYASVFEKLGFPIRLNSSASRIKITLNNKTKELLGSRTQNWLGIAPFAAFKGKMYPMDLMLTVIKELNDTEKYKIILFGGPHESSQLNGIAEQFKNVSAVVGQLGFDEELQLISNLDLMLSMDSGNGHLAAIYGTPTITLWGVTHPYAGFYPFGQDPGNALMADRDRFPLIPTSVYGNKFPEGYERAIATIAPATIVRKVQELLLQAKP